MFKRLTLVSCLLAAPLAPLSVSSVIAAEPPTAEQSQELTEVLRLREIVEIIADEGIAAAPDVEADMFPGRGGVGWLNEVARINDTDRLWDMLLSGWPGPMTAEDTAELMDFFSSDLGRAFVDQEVEVRRAMLDPTVDDATRDAGAELREANTPRATLLADFIAAYDLVSQNVVGGMNSNFAFFMGLEAGGALPEAMTEEQILRQVYQQRDGIEEDLTNWLFGYLGAAYAPFSDEELQTYIDFAQTDAAQAFNRAIFEGFNVLFETTSRDLGRAVAGYLVAEDI